MASRVRSSLVDGANQFKTRTPKETRLKSFKRKRPLSRQSRLRAVEAKIYRIKRDRFLTEHPICQKPGCGNRSQDCHHAARRGENYLRESTWLALCRACHTWTHQHPNQARAIGLLENK